jgi:hypothetical protein
MGFYSFGGGLPTFNGMPMVGGTPLEITTGRTFWVGSTTYTTGGAAPSNGNKGTSPTQAWSTLDYALSRTTSGMGDTIYVMPGFTQNITAAGSITFSTTGVKVIGLGEGSLRPTLYFTTAAAATLAVTSDNCKMKNFYIDMTKVNAVASGILVSANNFWFDQNEIYFAKASYVAIKVMSTVGTTLTNLKITGNKIHGDEVASCTSAFQDLGGDGHEFSGNLIVGNFSTNLGCINNVTGALTNITVSNNILENRTALANKVVVLAAGDTGRIVNNRIGYSTAITVLPITAAGCYMGGNYFASNFATVATLL